MRLLARAAIKGLLTKALKVLRKALKVLRRLGKSQQKPKPQQGYLPERLRSSPRMGNLRTFQRRRSQENPLRKKLKRVVLLKLLKHPLQVAGQLMIWPESTLSMNMTRQSSLILMGLRSQQMRMVAAQRDLLFQTGLSSTPSPAIARTISQRSSMTPGSRRSLWSWSSRPSASVKSSGPRREQPERLRLRI